MTDKLKIEITKQILTDAYDANNDSFYYWRGVIDSIHTIIHMEDGNE